MQIIDFKAQADQAIKGIIARNLLDDAIFARKNDDFGGLAYIIAMGLKLDHKQPIKFGLIFEVVDTLDALEVVWTSF